MGPDPCDPCNISDEAQSRVYEEPDKRRPFEVAVNDNSRYLMLKGPQLLMSPLSVKDAFRVLNLPEGATPDEIKNGYRIMALKYHPDRHLTSHSREAATRYFLEVTEAYRTLVRGGHVKNRTIPMAKSRPESPPQPPPWRAPPMAHKNSSESSISLDSFVHMVASSSESLTTPPSSKRASLRSTWKQGIRQPAEATSSPYRNLPGQSHTHGYETPPRGGTTGLTLPTATLFSADSTIPIPSNNHSRNSSNSQHKGPSSPLSSQAKHTSFPPAGNRVPPTNAKLPQQPPGPNGRSQFPPYAIPLLSIGLGPSGEWAYALSLTLEELFVGKHFRFGITRTYISGKTKNVVIEIDIPAGCRQGTRILCRNVGHEWQQGVYQDIAFVIEEVPHDRFVRVVDDLVMDVRLPWVDSLRRQGGKVPFVGIDGRAMCIHIDYPQDKSVKGRSVLKGAGMPVRERGQVVGRGNMVVQWEILPPKTKIFHFIRRLWRGK